MTETDLEQMGPVFSIPERLLASELGVSVEYLRDIRKKGGGDLVDGVHYETHSGRPVFYSVEGSLIVRKKVAGDDSLAPTEGQQLPLVIVPPAVEELTVFSVPRRNVKMLDARKADGTAVRVRVRDNTNFMPGMTIKATPSGEFADVYVLEGRCPRYRGRW